MNCEKCSIRDFVHSDIYCQGCTQKPKPRIKTGRAYMFPRSSTTCRPITSIDVEAPEGMETIYSAVALLGKVKIEFIESDSRELIETILREP